MEPRRPVQRKKRRRRRARPAFEPSARIAVVVVAIVVVARSAAATSATPTSRAAEMTGFAGRSLLRTRAVRRAGALALRAEKSSPPLPTSTRFAPLPLPHPLPTAAAAASPLAPPLWSPTAPSAPSYSVAAGIPDRDSEERAVVPPDPGADNFSRYSKFLVRNSNGVDGLSGRSSPGAAGGEEEEEPIRWVDSLGAEGRSSAAVPDEEDRDPGVVPRPFSLLSWNVLAQNLYEAQHRRMRIQKVALSAPGAQREAPVPPSPRPHPWPLRARRILEVLTRADADVICLQECELRSFATDLAPALSRAGYDGAAQEDDRPDRPTGTHEATRHREPRHHIVATFWRRNKFEAVGEASVRTRSMTVVLRQKASDEDGDDGGVASARPTVAVVNVHLEGHPRRFSERTHQLQHAMSDLAKRIAQEGEGETSNPNEGARDVPSDRIGDLNALVLAGDFNCELRSSACSAYLRMGRLGRRAGLGGVHGEGSLALPPSLLGSTEAAEVLHPILEWGRPLPEEEVSDVDPHPFRRCGMTSAYPSRLGDADASEHFTFCSELTRRPVPGLDQVWYTGATLDRRALRRTIADDAGPTWERYFYDEEEVAARREEERRRVLTTGLPSPDGRYPSDHLPVGAAFDWKLDERGDDGSGANDSDGSCAEGKEVRCLHVVDAEGNDVREILPRAAPRPTFDDPREELAHLVAHCPYDSPRQSSDVRFVLSALDPPLDPVKRERPAAGQLEQLAARRERKAELLSTASAGVRPWLRDIWKASKRAGKWERRQRMMEEKSRATEEGKR
ncbi:hypothetical protein ACHAWF_016664 [Thalassiosira exigua]